MKASEGKGCDRHLFGLRFMLKENEPIPAIFQDPSFAKAMSYGLSTSQLGANTHEYAIGTGFGNAMEKGYGLNYFFSDNSIKVGIECKINSNPKDITDVYRVLRFKEAWYETMRDMKYILDSAALNVDTPIRNGIKSSGWWYRLPEHDQGNSAYPRVAKL
eukprot:NODE_1117_length_2134_cov_1.696314.p3 type:complete len:160 gc:universal NODE_1117_length_2134_cov_1.696314:1283-804(-)